MFQGLDHVSRALRILVGRNAMLNQRLYEAAREFSVALERPDQWPADLLDDARSVHRELTSKGSIDATINGMDVSVAGQIAQQLCTLVLAVNSAQGVRREPGHVQLPSRKSGRKQRLDVS